MGWMFLLKTKWCKSSSICPAEVAEWNDNSTLIEVLEVCFRQIPFLDNPFSLQEDNIQSTNIVDRWRYCSQYSHNVSCWHWQSEHNHLDDQKKEKAVGLSCVISSAISSQHNSFSNNIPTISLRPCPPPPQKILRDWFPTHKWDPSDVATSCFWPCEARSFKR